jgi:hypothetical protein
MPFSSGLDGWKLDNDETLWRILAFERRNRRAAR